MKCKSTNCKVQSANASLIDKEKTGPQPITGWVGFDSEDEVVVHQHTLRKRGAKDGGLVQSVLAQDTEPYIPLSGFIDL